MSFYYALLASAVVLWLVYRHVICGRVTNAAIPQSNEKTKAAESQDPLRAYQDIEPLHDFDWETTPPMKLRPFKPKYHLTMALEMVSLSDLLQMDNTYLSRIKLRRQLMDDHPEATLACNDVAGPAALELYDWIVGTYLPRRFPTCYSLVVIDSDTAGSDTGHSAPDQPQQNPTHLLNRITSERIPLHQPHPLTALRTLSSHIDTDFLILLPQTAPSQPTQPTTTPQPSSSQHPSSPPQQPQPQPQYHLQAYSTTFPSGFSTLSKLSLPLSAIHAPVPSYKPKLSLSMDRFFARLPPGQLARRANWTITTTPDLFTESGTHMHCPQSAEEEAASVAAQKESLDVEEMRLRCELQTLFRLPGSGALVFAFKTYRYGLGEVKGEEGMGEALAEATEGFLKGSVPEMSIYKREAVWGEVVREFLRS